MFPLPVSGASAQTIVIVGVFCQLSGTRWVYNGSWLDCTSQGGGSNQHLFPAGGQAPRVLKESPDEKRKRRTSKDVPNLDGLGASLGGTRKVAHHRPPIVHQAVLRVVPARAAATCLELLAKFDQLYPSPLPPPGCRITPLSPVDLALTPRGVCHCSMMCCAR